MRSRLLTYLLVGFLAISTHFAQAQGVGSDQFEKRIRPLLIDKCVSCHGPAKQKGGLRVDGPDSMAIGGDSGPAVVAGKPDESRLIEVVKYSSDLKMPPKGKLSDAEIADLVTWVREGATWPGSSTKPTTLPKPPPTGATPLFTTEEKAFWAFQPPVNAIPPAVKKIGWVQSPIDQFLLASLERNRLEPAPPASKRDLIRRVTFDLTGLPPTPEEVDAFLGDRSPDAFANVVDRLLATKHYGERWARHWLDLARYADSNGMDENVAYANAHYYRDYVIDSFNADKPYDVFLKEQLAGDLMPASENPETDRSRVTATGFLVLGPKMLAEDDPMKMEMDIIDEQVDTVGRVFMGLTIGCARCHDHKFDPIPTADYYGLAGIFKSTKSMQNHKVVAMWNERALATDAQKAQLERHRKELDDLNTSSKTTIDKARAALRKELRTRTAEYVLAGWESRSWVNRDRTPTLAKNDSKLPVGTIVREAEKFDKGNVLVDTSHYGPGIGVILNKGELPNFVEYKVEVAEPASFDLEIRYAAAEPRPATLLVNGKPRTGEITTKTTGSWLADSQRWHSEGVVRFNKGVNTIRIESAGPFVHIDKLAIVPTQVPAASSPAELAKRHGLNEHLVERWAEFWSAQLMTKDSPLRTWFEGSEPAKSRAELFAKKLAEAEKADAKTLAKQQDLAALKKLSIDPAGPLLLPRGAAVEKLYSVETSETLAKTRAQIKEVEARAPVVKEVMGVQDQKVANLRVHIRGSHLTLGDEAPRGFVRVVSVEKSPQLTAKQSGRLELAEWLTRPDHPLTARVMVNRLWAAHFGEGLVRSPDNFGRLGDRPTHPELLDWLARRFVESGWSIKAMHRTILLTSAYQMSSRFDAGANELDPDNRLYWRANRRRLEAEAVRDAILAVSGRLDSTMGGSFLPTKNHAYVNNTGQRGSVSYDLNRRSVYLPVIRSGLYDVFQAFDFADPSASNGKRIPTTVAPQALFMLNDPLVLRGSEAMAKRLLDRKDLDDRGRLDQAYRQAYGRKATDEEVKRALAYLKRFDASLETNKVASELRPVRTWQSICQAILASSEFLYLD